NDDVAGQKQLDNNYNEIFSDKINYLEEILKKKKMQEEEDKINIITAITDAIEKNNSSTRIKINSNDDSVSAVIDKIYSIPSNNYNIEYKIDTTGDDTYCDFEIKKKNNF